VAGHSTRGRKIRLITLTGALGRRGVLVVGCIHGTECAGQAITRMPVSGGAPSVGTIWVVPDINPDGHALHTRVNARGVDLNRNFPSQWRRIGRRGDPQYSGPRPLSERESVLAVHLIRRLRPAVTIWFHRPQDVVRSWGQSIPLARHYAQLAGARFRAIRWPSGSATSWQNHHFPGAAAFVVELAAGPLPAHQAARFAHAVRALTAGG
jgi:protein MpaA